MKSDYKETTAHSESSCAECLLLGFVYTAVVSCDEICCKNVLCIKVLNTANTHHEICSIYRP